MTLRELHYLVAVAEHGHYARAANACHVGQPTLSTQLRKLEHSLGVEIFDRSRRGVHPTPAGERVIAQARVVLEEAERLRALGQEHRDPMLGTLRLGVIPTLGPYFLPHLVPVVRRYCPQLRLMLREELTGGLLVRLRDGRLDALLVTLPVAAQGVEVEALFSESFCAAVPVGHPLAKRARIAVGDLVPEEMLLLEEGHCLRDQALDLCRHARAPQGEEMRATSLETLRQMVAAGVGCTLLPRLASSPLAQRRDDSLVEYRPFTEPAPRRIVGMVWRRHYARSGAVRGLIELIRAHLPAEVEVA